MAFLSKLKLFASTVLCTILFCCYSGCSAEDNPVQLVQNALSCFNNKFIYAGCEEPYRLDQSGSINVPPIALNSFCHGPCLRETQLVLNCVDGILSNFLFDNKATVRDIRGAINVGCTYSNRERGLFNFGELLQDGDFGGADRLRSSVIFFVAFLSIGSYYFILF